MEFTDIPKFHFFWKQMFYYCNKGFVSITAAQLALDFNILCDADWEEIEEALYEGMRLYERMPTATEVKKILDSST